MEIGIYSFAEIGPDPHTGRSRGPGQRLRDLLEEITLADQVGLDAFGVGEHHRPDYAVSAPAVVLGAAAALTKRIRLTSAVSVLSSDDPVRVFQDFVTLDLLSRGRAEIMAGRGSFVESFPLFGYAPADRRCDASREGAGCHRTARRRGRAGGPSRGRAEGRRRQRRRSRPYRRSSSAFIRINPSRASLNSIRVRSR
jgi:alkanesulfonate monooxygenase SsuD/methylene tetrahydromethanopterin reductase-like flavin-dependent oxidoreductase (luciferase family)